MILCGSLAEALSERVEIKVQRVDIRKIIHILLTTEISIIQGHKLKMVLNINRRQPQLWIVQPNVNVL